MGRPLPRRFCICICFRILFCIWICICVCICICIWICICIMWHQRRVFCGPTLSRRSRPTVSLFPPPAIGNTRVALFCICDTSLPCKIIQIQIHLSSSKKRKRQIISPSIIWNTYNENNTWLPLWELSNMFYPTETDLTYIIWLTRWVCKALWFRAKHVCCTSTTPQVEEAYLPIYTRFVGYTKAISVITTNIYNERHVNIQYWFSNSFDIFDSLSFNLWVF